MLSKDFYGKNSFVWWTGIVENDEDPLMLGSVQVRIIGIHSNNTNLVPTESLPWAQVIQPANGSGTVSAPRPGDWVMGFFQDGDYAQIPVVMGVYNGIESSQSQTIYREVVVKRGANNVPQPSQFDRAVGEPTTSRMSRGVMKGTLTNTTNSLLSSACDVKGPIVAGIAWAKLKNSEALKAIKDFIVEYLVPLLGDGTGIITTIMETLKWVASKLRYLNRLLKPVIEWGIRAAQIAAVARAILDWILKLPARFQKFLKNCLSKIIGGIGAIISELFSTSGLGGGDFTELKNTFNDTLSALKETTISVATVASIPAKIAEGFLNPPNATAQKEANAFLTNLVSSNNTNGENIFNQTMTSKASSKTP
jgi:hypothetical protein